MDYDDAPETPAPLFALKAFRHAIFGTPNMDDKAGRAKQTRASTLPIRSARRSLDVASSPAKGILVTPGTAASKRKTVSFGGQHGRMERLNSAATPHAPGHFPAVAELDEQQKNMWRTDLRATTDGREGPTVAGVLLPRRAARATTTKDEEEETIDMSAPKSASGKYWKSEYETFSTQSSLEVKKLAKKAKLSKTFAKSKDDEVLELSEQLRKERRKVAELEKKLANFEQRLSKSVSTSRQVRHSGRNEKHQDDAWNVKSTKGTEAREAEQAAAEDSHPTSYRRAHLDSRSVSGEAARNGASTGRMTANQRQADVGLGQTKSIQVDPLLASSDMWMDVERPHVVSLQSEQDRVKERKPLVRQSSAQETEARRPLRQRSTNLDEKPAAAVAGSPGSRATEDRRAAAKQRLEAKRKMKNSVLDAENKQ